MSRDDLVRALYGAEFRSIHRQPRCAVPECPNDAKSSAYFPGQMLLADVSLCDDHRSRAALALAMGLQGVSPPEPEPEPEPAPASELG